MVLASVHGLTGEYVSSAVDTQSVTVTVQDLQYIQEQQQCLLWPGSSLLSQL